MKKVRILALPVVAALVMTACGNNNDSTVTKEESTGTTMEKMEGHDAGNHATGAVMLKDDKLNAVYQHYVHLTTALTNSDVAEAKVAANAIEAGAKNLDGGNAIAGEAAKITATDNIEKQRAVYEDLSKQMMEKVKASGVADGELYVQYCPMAFENKGASWLSSSKEIRNPYFGNKMLTCGETKETLK